ncbi:ORF6N domain-containing protein [Olivibacter domesticus]|uniref:ORF6N domain-containing protein n=1 Tax=Olivibacter domesticus TaxID=407022 RepID=A0A1H7WPZ7_OLID1|nr:ORF6N domain-containing protein [Olivibacter domesticus]SEM23108.1 ORF6N domain-containing protein [Olivibacter domesticus]
MPNTKPITENLIIPEEVVMNEIYYIRDQKVMLDRDLAELYGVETKVLKQAVKRNIDRFPKDFHFQLTTQQKNELVTNCDRFEKLTHAIVTANALRYRKLRNLNQKSFNITNCDLQ